MDLISTALPALAEAFSLILQPEQIGFLILGVLLGLSAATKQQGIFFPLVKRYGQGKPITAKTLNFYCSL